jgi:hypothetical protein
MDKLMKINQGKALAVLLVLLAIVATSSLSNGSGKAMRNHFETLVDGPLYLPVIYKNYPLRNVFGINTHTLDLAGGLEQVAQAGSVWTRNGFIWETIEPTQGARNWNTELEQGLIRADTLGVELIMLIEDTPGWALKAGYDCGAVAQEQFPALAQFAYDLVKRYSAPPYNVRYWELWNEPDVWGILGCWGDPSDTDYYGGYYYGQMLQVVYPRIKEADPRAQVLVGGLLLDCDPINPPFWKDCTSSRFLEGVMASGAGPFFDGVSFHAYDYYTGKGTYDNVLWSSSYNTTGPVSIAKARYLKEVLAQYGYEEKYLMNTETAVLWGWDWTNPLPCDPSAPPDVEVTKVYYVIHSYTVAVAEGWKANVWYSALGYRCTGLLNSDLSPKPAYYAYQFAQQKLGEAVFVRQIAEYPQVMGYEYETTGKNLWVLWSLDGQAHTILLPKQPVEVNRVGEDGRAVLEPTTGTMIIDLSPRFVEFSK